MTPYILETCIS